MKSVWTVPVRRAMLACLLVGITGCGDSPPGSGDNADGELDLSQPDPAAIEAADDILAKMPAENAQVVGGLDPSQGPRGALPGLMLDDGTAVFPIGQVEDDAITITGAVVQDSDGRVILQQEITNDSLRFTYPTGDSAMMQVVADGVHIEIVANATIPPTVVVANVNAEGDVIIDEDASFFGEVENPAYDMDRAIVAKQRPSFARRRPLQPQTIGPIEDIAPIEFCDELVDVPLFVVEGACDLKNLLVNSLLKVPELAANTFCISMLRLLDSIKGGSIGTRVGAGVKFGLTLGCEGFKHGLRAAALAGKLTPVDLACLGTSLLDEGVQVVSGESTGDFICDVYARLKEDEDQDTIINHKDNCPNDFNTGQTDTDDDGVGDACDDCLGTPLGVSVDGVGCADDLNPDSDNDGVINAFDQCPDTLRGMAVDENGCAECENDDDNDGVLNCDDNCPNFMTTNTRDGDGDGVGDDCDNCPDNRNPDQADTNQNGRGDACEGIASIISWTDTDGSSGADAEGSPIQILGDPQFPIFSWDADLDAHLISVSEISDVGGAPLWFVSAIIIPQDENQAPIPTTFSSTALQYGTATDPNAIVPEDFPPSPPLAPGVQYIVAITTLDEQTAGVFFTINE